MKADGEEDDEDEEAQQSGNSSENDEKSPSNYGDRLPNEDIHTARQEAGPCAGVLIEGKSSGIFLKPKIELRPDNVV